MLGAEGAELTSWSNGPGDAYAEHRHDYDKALVAVAGSILFRLPELNEDVLLEAGDRLDLPAGTLHAADVGPTGVTCLESHSGAGSLSDRPRRIPAWADADASRGAR